MRLFWECGAWRTGNNQLCSFWIPVLMCPLAKRHRPLRGLYNFCSLMCLCRFYSLTSRKPLFFFLVWSPSRSEVRWRQWRRHTIWVLYAYCEQQNCVFRFLLHPQLPLRGSILPHLTFLLSQDESWIFTEQNFWVLDSRKHTRGWIWISSVQKAKGGRDLYFVCLIWETMVMNGSFSKEELQMGN